MFKKYLLNDARDLKTLSRVLLYEYIQYCICMDVQFKKCVLINERPVRISATLAQKTTSLAV